MKFELTQEEEKMLHEWEQNHECSVRGKAFGIGGVTTISFTPTGVGTAVEATCVCGAKFDVREL